MSSDHLDRSMSSLSITSTDSQPEDDWDRSLILNDSAVPIDIESLDLETRAAISKLTTPRNSVVFPVEETPGRETRFHSRDASLKDAKSCGKKRTLSELLRLHSEKTSNGEFSPEEASRIADVLGQWINASSSPYEGEDDFFKQHSQDDINLNAAKRIMGGQPGRPRGRSESANAASNSRPGSSLGGATGS